MSLKGFVYIPNGLIPEELMPNADYVTDTVHRWLSLPSDSLALIVQGDYVLGIGRLRPIRTFYTFERVIRVEDIERLPEDGIPISTVLSSLSNQTLSHANRKFRDGGIIGEATWNKLQAVLSRLSPLIGEYIRRANSFLERPPWFADQTSVARGIVEHERDAVGLAMKIAGSNHSSIGKWYPRATPEPFLAGLDHVQLTEDNLLQNDMGVFGDWNFEMSNGLISTFSSADENSLTVINANRQSMERTLGADLVYWNHKYRAFVIVQYKRMRPSQSTGQDATYYPDSDRHLGKQFMQMKKLETIEPESPSSQGNYRLGREFCFLKVCKPILEFKRPSLSAGKYMSIELWSLLENEARNRGGSFTVKMGSTDRYMTNTNFVDMVGKGWIGSYGFKTDLISTYINEALSGGRSVTLAASAERPIHPA